MTVDFCCARQQRGVEIGGCSLQVNKVNSYTFSRFVVIVQPRHSNIPSRRQKNVILIASDLGVRCDILYRCRLVMNNTEYTLGLHNTARLCIFHHFHPADVIREGFLTTRRSSAYEIGGLTAWIPRFIIFLGPVKLPRRSSKKFHTSSHAKWRRWTDAACEETI